MNDLSVFGQAQAMRSFRSLAAATCVVAGAARLGGWTFPAWFVAIVWVLIALVVLPFLLKMAADHGRRYPQADSTDPRRAVSVALRPREWKQKTAWLLAGSAIVLLWMIFGFEAPNQDGSTTGSRLSNTAHLVVQILIPIASAALALAGNHFLQTRGLSVTTAHKLWDGRLDFYYQTLQVCKEFILLAYDRRTNAREHSSGRFTEEWQVKNVRWQKLDNDIGSAITRSYLLGSTPAIESLDQLAKKVRQLGNHVGDLNNVHEELAECWHLFDSLVSKARSDLRIEATDMTITAASRSGQAD